MKKILCKLILFFLLGQSVFAANWVLCSIWKYEGCEGYEAPRSGSARTWANSGNARVGRTERVERRTIIKIPDYSIRRFWRSLGLGGRRINISYQDSGNVHTCPQQDETAPVIENSLLRNGGFSECMTALQKDLISVPRGIYLKVLQCQEYFCNEEFKAEFSEFLEKTEKTENQGVPNVEEFLGCSGAVVDV